MDDGRVAGVDRRGAAQEAERAERCMVRPVFVESLHILPYCFCLFGAGIV
jgi:hypothetical protein